MRIVETLAARARCRVGGGVRTPERAQSLIRGGAHRIIVGTSAFTKTGVNHELLASMPHRDKLIIALDSKGGLIVVKGWTESIDRSAEDLIAELEPYCAGFLCTYVDKEGMMQGTDLEWFRRLRTATTKEITAAGGITTYDEILALRGMNIHAALGMAVYTGRLDLARLAAING